MSKLRDLSRTVILMTTGVIATWAAATAVVLIAWRNSTSKRIDWVARKWSTVLLRAAGVRLVVTGLEHIDQSQAYVVVSNHTSNLDIPAHFAALPLTIRFLAKKELYGIPVFGHALRSIGIIQVDRQAGASIHDELNRQCAEAIALGRSLLVYAEGHRTRTGEMQPFKRGAFSIAIGTGTPILPVSLHGGYQAWPPGSPVRGGTMHVMVSPPVHVTGLTQQDVGTLRDNVRSVIADQLERVTSR